jgi:hypothetical protein
MSDAVPKNKQIEKDEALIRMRFKLEERFDQYKSILDEKPIGSKSSPYYRVKKLEITR